MERPTGLVRRNPGRMDGVQWNGDSFVCARQVDGDVTRVRIHDSVDVEEQEDDLVAEHRPHDEPLVISLLDIARPAKRRGEQTSTNVHSFVVLITTQELRRDTRCYRRYGG